MHCISRSGFSSVFVVGSILGKEIYIKKFIKKSQYKINDFDLKPLYQRNRSAVSVWGYNNFYRNRSLRKYIPSYMKQIILFNIIISASNTVKKNICVKSNEKKPNTESWLEIITKMTLDIRKADLDLYEKIPKFIKNKEVWQLKRKLQLFKPLSYLVNENTAKSLIEVLGENNRIAHGDLQPKNIVYDGKAIEIVDFEESFVGPKDWDEGFLWGNILYKCGNKRIIFDKAVEKWTKLSSGHNNFVIISVAICMMRLSMFSIYNYDKSTTTRLKNFCQLKINQL